MDGRNHLGVGDLVVTLDGEILSKKKEINRFEKRIKRFQRKISRKIKGKYYYKIDKSFPSSKICSHYVEKCGK